MPHNLEQSPADPQEAAARRAEEEADRAALARLYGGTHKKKEARGQIGVAVALLVLGPGLVAWGAASGGDPGLIGVGVVAVGVGAWAAIDGLLRARRAARAEQDDSRKGR